MTHEEQDAIVGRTHRELRDVREQLAKLRARAREFSDSYSTVAHHMNNHPERLRLSIEEARAQLRPGTEPHILKPDALEIKSVLAIRDEIRARIIDEERLVKSLSAMGYNDR